MTELHECAGPTFSAEEMIAMREKADEEELQVHFSLLSSPYRILLYAG